MRWTQERKGGYHFGEEEDITGKLLYITKENIMLSFVNLIYLPPPLAISLLGFQYHYPALWMMVVENDI